MVVLVRSARNFRTMMCIFQPKNSTYVKATFKRYAILNFDSTGFLFPNSKAFGILWKYVQTFVICQRSLKMQQ